MTNKKYSKKWLKQLIADVSLIVEENIKENFAKLVESVSDYIKYLDKNDSKRGRGTSQNKKKSSRINGRLGGRPKKAVK